MTVLLLCDRNTVCIYWVFMLSVEDYTRNKRVQLFSLLIQWLPCGLERVSLRNWKNKLFTYNVTRFPVTYRLLNSACVPVWLMVTSFPIDALLQPVAWFYSPITPTPPFHPYFFFSRICPYCRRVSWHTDFYAPIAFVCLSFVGPTISTWFDMTLTPFWITIRVITHGTRASDSFNVVLQCERICPSGGINNTLWPFQ